MLTNLKQLRICRGMSQKQLACEVGVSQQSINKYENHNIEPDIATLIRIADIFHTSVDYLVGHDDLTVETNVLQLTLEETILLRRYRRLNDRQRKSIELVIENYLEEQGENNKYNHMEKQL